MRTLLRDIYLEIFGNLKRPAPGLHIVNSHYVTASKPQPNDVKTFETFLKYLSKFGTLISMETALSYLEEGSMPTDEVLITLTFDDGFEECHSIIAPLLEQYNAKGTFFINSNYIEATPSYQKEFHDRLKIHTKSPMEWQQVIDLHKRGHTIGSHTRDHYNMAALTDDELEVQVRENKKTLEEKLTYTCNCFAWPYGQDQDFPKQALEITEKYHPYIFSGTNYQKYFSRSGRIINRRHLEPFWKNSHIKYFLSVEKE
ncbi:polysaccharide deacetylase family protein [Luteirhabdus pelagi]|uniref:polysaccharide deacetylase family protein n=1 Tax=Luteirhabdus pelagi TaxID=2792783 RepID=UPI00193AB735|nr:polysaccharide deacetylase family protein [Luteirhabdus pelagi]